MEFAQQLQQTALARFVGESGSLLGYPTILFLHTLGLATVAGLAAGIDLRVLGLAPAVRLGPMIRLYPLMWAAFVIATLSGIALLIADATTKLTQTVFYIKLLLVALAVITMQLMRTRVLRDPMVDERPLDSSAKMLAAASLVLWIGATIAGRLIAYIY
jgi:hypothetical protein